MRCTVMLPCSVHYHWEKCAKPFLNVILENNQSHKSGANSMLYNAAMKDFPLLSHIFIWNSPVFFALMKCQS